MNFFGRLIPGLRATLAVLSVLLFASSSYAAVFPPTELTDMDDNPRDPLLWWETVYGYTLIDPSSPFYDPGFDPALSMYYPMFDSSGMIKILTTYPEDCDWVSVYKDFVYGSVKDSGFGFTSRDDMPDEGVGFEGASVPENLDFGVTESKRHRSGTYFDVYLSSAVKSESPTILYLHDGDWSSDKDKDGDHVDFLYELAGQGYLVVSADYQLQNNLLGGAGSTREGASFSSIMGDIDEAVSYIGRMLPSITEPDDDERSTPLGLSTNKFIIIGAGAGAHLAALYAWDEANPARLKLGLKHEMSVSFVVDIDGPLDLADTNFTSSVSAMVKSSNRDVKARGNAWLKLLSALTGGSVTTANIKNNGYLVNWSPVNLANANAAYAILAGTTNASSISTIVTATNKLGAAAMAAANFEVADADGLLAKGSASRKWLVDQINDASARLLDYYAGFKFEVDRYFTYDGNAYGPNVTVVSHTNATVRYSATMEGPFSETAPTQVNAGTYTLYYEVSPGDGVAPGSGEYFDVFTNSVLWRINQAEVDMTGVAWEYDPSRPFIYDSFTHDVAVTGAIPAMVELTGYKGASAYDAGTNIATVTFRSTDPNYFDPIFSGCTWAIDPRDISSAVVTLEDPAPIYNAMVQTQNVQTVLISLTNADLYVTFDVSGNYADVPGDYEMVIEGNGNYCGRLTQQWRLFPATISFSDEDILKQYDGTGHGLELGASALNPVMIKYAASAVGPYRDVEPLFTNACTDVVVWYTIMADHYYTVVTNKKVTVSPKPLAQSMVPEIPDQTYRGWPLEPYVELSDVLPAVVTSNDYTISYADNVELGYAGVTLTGRNNYTGTATAEFRIVTVELQPVTKDGRLTMDGQKQYVSFDTWVDGVEIYYTTDGSDPAPPNGTKIEKGGEIIVDIGTTIRTAAYNSSGAMAGDIVIEKTAQHATVGGSGVVTEPKSIKLGAKNSWKAKADKGSVFACWEGPLTNGLSRNECRNPTLNVVVGSLKDADLTKAVFVSVDDDQLRSLTLSSVEPITVGMPVSGLSVVDDSASYVTASVKGLPSGLKFDAKTMQITGAAKTAGEYVIGITAKNAAGYQWQQTATITVIGGTPAVVKPQTVKPVAYHPLVVRSADTVMGTVTGTGVYAEGKAAKISAKANKGYVFAGWYQDRDCRIPFAFEKGDFRNPSQSVTMPNARYLFARFVGIGNDPVTVLRMTRSGADIAEADVITLRVGVALPKDDPYVIAFESASLPSASVAKLPSGVKFDKNTGCFTGVPTKAGTNLVEITVKNVSKMQQKIVQTFVVDQIDAWAYGAFDGGVEQTTDDDSVTIGQSAITIGNTGKISGKMLYDGVSLAMTAASYTEYSNGVYSCDAATVKVGKVLFPASFIVQRNTSGQNGLLDGVAVVDGVTNFIDGVGNVWKLADNAAFSKEIIGKGVTIGPISAGVCDALTLVVKGDGKVSVTGVFPHGVFTGTAVMQILDENLFRISVYLAPNAKKGFDAGYAASLRVTYDPVSGDWSAVVE